MLKGQVGAILFFISLSSGLSHTFAADVLFPTRRGLIKATVVYNSDHLNLAETRSRRGKQIALCTVALSTLVGGTILGKNLQYTSIHTYIHSITIYLSSFVLVGAVHGAAFDFKKSLSNEPLETHLQQIHNENYDLNVMLLPSSGTLIRWIRSRAAHSLHEAEIEKAVQAWLDSPPSQELLEKIIEIFESRRRIIFFKDKLSIKDIFSRSETEVLTSDLSGLLFHDFIKTVLSQISPGTEIPDYHPDWNARDYLGKSYFPKSEAINYLP
ncbi:MAG: hypothetical protein JWQ35_2772 [Bacteriovoracaceae bacterium]|nr:hypothetical protein [Bacteriovoracaceae bacterium]